MPIQSAITNKSGTSMLYVNNPSATNSLLQFEKSGRRYYPKIAKTVDSILIPTITIDDFCNKESIQEIDILKMDVQGGEMIALNGALESLKMHIFSLIYTEIMFTPFYKEGVMFWEICNFLSKYKYTFFDMYDLQYARNGQLTHADAIFVSQKIRKNVIDAIRPEP
jgi:FkbM family methyltransferase